VARRARLPREDARSDARERALLLLYEAEVKDRTGGEILAGLVVPPDELTQTLVRGVDEHRDELDRVIREHARNWTLERMPAVDRTVLRIAMYELAHRTDVPTAVVIDEAVTLAKRFSTDDSGRFVNGMLSAVAPKLRPAPTAP
jgi:N utilization substance protein B